MVEPSELTELRSLWRGRPPGVLGTRCLNVRHQARNCRICVEACPVEAIAIPSTENTHPVPIALNEDRCVRCGLCLNACPTGVFVELEPSGLDLLRAIARSPSPVIELACPRKEPASLSRVPEASVAQTTHCLAALSAPTLIQLTAAGKTVWLNDSICRSCPIGEAHQAIQGTVTAANHWLEVLGQPNTIYRYASTPRELSETPISRPVIGSDRSVMSRRDFFRSLTGRTAKGTGSASHQPLSKRPSSLRGAEAPVQITASAAGDGTPLAHHVPAHRQQLTHLLGQLSPDPSACVPTANLPIADVSVTRACTASGLCAQLCPTQAITFVSDDEYYVLNFLAGPCLGEDCSLCALGCPTQAVVFGQEVTVEELIGTDPRPLKAGRLEPCAECGTLTDAPMEVEKNDAAPLCHACQSGAKRPEAASGPLTG
jgi:ferredoxin